MEKTKLYALIIVCVFSISSFIFILGNQNESEKNELKANTDSTLIYRFGVGACGHIGETVLENSNPDGERNIILANSLVYQEVDRYFEIGDSLDDASFYSLYPTIKNIYDGMGIPYHLVRGNHDNGPYMLSTFGMNSYHYNITVGDMVFLMMDSADHYLPNPPAIMNATQMQYIEDALNYYDDRLVFILYHVSNVKLAYPAIEAQSDEFQALLESHSDHIGGVFTAHVHNYNIMTYEINSVYYSYAGTFGNGYSMGGLPYLPYRYLVVEVYDDWETRISSICPDDNTQIHGPNEAYTPTTGLSPVWNAASDDALASVEANWLNGVPSEGKTVIFNDTSVKRCNWDIDIENNMFINTGFTGTINQTVETTFHHFIIRDGWFVPNVSYRVEITGNFIMTDTHISNNLLRLEMSGDYVKWSFPSNIPAIHELIVSGNVYQMGNVYLPSAALGCNITGDLYIAENRKLSVVNFETGLIVSGTINGYGDDFTQGTLHLYAVYFNDIIPELTGTLNCGLRLASDGDCKYTLNHDLTIGGALVIRRSGDTIGTQTATLLSNNHTISSGGLQVWIGGIWNQYNSIINVNGDWDCLNGTFTHGNGAVTFSGEDSYIVLDDDAIINNLYMYDIDVRFNFSAAQVINFIESDLTLSIFNYERITIELIIPSSQGVILYWTIVSDVPDYEVSYVVGGLSENWVYRIYENGDFNSEKTSSATMIQFYSEGNSTLVVVRYTMNNIYADAISDILASLIIAAVFIGVIAMFSVGKRRRG